MDKHFVLSKIKDYEAHLDNVAPLMESDDQLIMNELIREINNTCHVKIRGFSDLCDSYIKGAGSIIAKHINCFHSHLIRSALVFHLVGSKKHECGRVNGCEQIIWNLYNEYRNSVPFVDNSIMMEFDSAFAQLKSKKLLDQLVSLAQDPYLFSFFPQTMKMLARWRDPSMEKVIMGYFANPGLVKTQIAMSLGRSADDASILQREYSRWDSHGQYTVIICLRYYPSIQVLDKLTQFEALTVEDMEKSLSKCCTRNDRIWIKDVYSDRLFTIRKSIAEIKKQLKDPPHNCAQPRHIIPADPNFEKKRNSSALFAREINLVTQPSFDCEQGINSQVQTACSNADAIFPVLGIVFCKNERFSLLRKTHVPLWNEPRISHVRLP